MTSVNETAKSLAYDAQCRRCGETICAGEPILYVVGREASGHNSKVFHIDRFCDKRKKNSSE